MASVPGATRVARPLERWPQPSAAVTHVHPDHFEEKTAALMDHALPLYAQNKIDAAAISTWVFRRAHC